MPKTDKLFSAMPISTSYLYFWSQDVTPNFILVIALKKNRKNLIQAKYFLGQFSKVFCE